MHYLKEEDYKNEQLTNGETIRINHSNCPAGTDRRQRLYITKTYDGKRLLAYCHNCGLSGSSRVGLTIDMVRNGKRNTLQTITVDSFNKKALTKFKYIQNNLQIIDTNSEQSLKILPPLLYSYLNKRNILSKSLSLAVVITKYQESLVYPLTDYNQLVYGYALKTVRYNKIVNDLVIHPDHKKLGMWIHRESRVLVITEDPLSALTIESVKHDVAILALLGTHLSQDMLIDILNFNPKKVLLALDSDTPGIVSAIKIQNSLRSVGINTQIITRRADVTDIKSWNTDKIVNRINEYY